MKGEGERARPNLEEARAAGGTNPEAERRARKRGRTERLRMMLTRREKREGGVSEDDGEKNNGTARAASQQPATKIEH